MKKMTSKWKKIQSHVVTGCAVLLAAGVSMASVAYANTNVFLGQLDVSANAEKPIQAETARAFLAPFAEEQKTGQITSVNAEDVHPTTATDNVAKTVQTVQENVADVHQAITADNETKTEQVAREDSAVVYRATATGDTEQSEKLRQKEERILLAENANTPMQKAVVTELDLGYWYKDIDEEAYASRLVKAAYSMPTTGKGYCAAWVSYVYQEAGLGFIDLNANDMWYNFGHSSDISEIKPGMIVAVPHSPTSELGRKYGHTGILVKNPSYVDVDTPENRALAQEIRNMIDELAAQYGASSNEQTQTRLNDAEQEKLEKQITKLQKYLDKLQYQIDHNCAYTKEIGGLTFEYDAQGHEKWLVMHNTDRVETTPLSAWIAKYDMTYQVAWGWGYVGGYRYLPFTADIAKTVPFVYRAEELKEEEDPQQLLNLYHIDYDHLTDAAAYDAICAYCKPTQSTLQRITLYGGSEVDSVKYNELLSKMTSSQMDRWARILKEKKAQDEAALLAAQEQEALEEETTEEETAEDVTEEDKEEDDDVIHLTEEIDAEDDEKSSDGQETSADMGDIPETASNTQGSLKADVNDADTPEDQTTKADSQEQTTSQQETATQASVNDATDASTSPETQALSSEEASTNPATSATDQNRESTDPVQTDTTASPETGSYAGGSGESGEETASTAEPSGENAEETVSAGEPSGEDAKETTSVTEPSSGQEGVPAETTTQVPEPSGTDGSEGSTSALPEETSIYEEPVQTQPVQTEPVQVEPASVESAQTEELSSAGSALPEPTYEESYASQAYYEETPSYEEPVAAE